MAKYMKLEEDDTPLLRLVGDIYSYKKGKTPEVFSDNLNLVTSEYIHETFEDEDIRSIYDVDYARPLFNKKKYVEDMVNDIYDDDEVNEKWQDFMDTMEKSMLKRMKKRK